MKTIDREAQMKYDIAKNEDGPLKRTMKTAESKAPEQPREETSTSRTEEDAAMLLTPARHPGLDERLVNIEKHLAVRYGSSPWLVRIIFYYYVDDLWYQFHRRRNHFWTVLNS